MKETFTRMRRNFAGVSTLLIIFAIASLAAAQQPSGAVEGIGFQNNYRPDCWTPMRIVLRPGDSKSDQYQIQVKQEDMDRDHPIFTRMITVTGKTAGANTGEDPRCWMYFKPQPTDDGLPDAMSELQELLHVSLYSTSGKFLAGLPITSNINNIDPKTGSFTYHRGVRMVLAVSDGQSAAVWRDYEQSIGLLESVQIISVQPRDLPESVLGYDAVDAIVWLSADPAKLLGDNEAKLHALRSFVNRGGSLVVCTPTDWQKLIPFFDLLPVTIDRTDSKENPEPLRSIGRTNSASALSFTQPDDGWDKLKGPFTMARAKAKPNARVIDWIEWKLGRDQTPWLVRGPLGAGEVTWVAQDLGDPAVTRAMKNWPKIWDHVLDLHNDTIVVTQDTSDDVKTEYKDAGAIDIGYSLLSGLELTSKSAWLVTLAIMFFIGYWLLAGPGTYAYLASKHRTGISWFLFAATALAATALTVLLVRLTLRGAPELRHLSLVRAASGEPAVIYSRFGLYIPRDGVQQIELKDMAPNSLAALSAFSIHPQHLLNENVPDDPGPEYQVSERDADSDEPAILRVPFRSTLKKFEADWTGEITGRVEGSGKLSEGGKIDGTLTNGTGKLLRNVYVAFFSPQTNAVFGGDDVIFFMPTWDAGASIDLSKKFNPKTKEGAPVKNYIFPSDGAPSPEHGDEFRATMKNYWQPYWFSQMHASALGEQKLDDAGRPVRASIPMLSFFSRLEPARNMRGQPPSRFEVLRRGARRYDVSAALSAGSLVVLAEGEEAAAIPIPLYVEGDRVTGSGSVVYQFILPLDASAIMSPATLPAD